MFPARFLCLLSLAPLAALPLAAQDLTPSFPLPEIRGGTGLARVERVLHVTYDVAADRVRTVRSGTPNELGLGAPPCFDNSVIELPEDPQYVVANPGEELLAWGRKFCRGSSRLRSFTMAYRSEADDTSIGGPGAVFGLALYSGTMGFGNSGAEVFRRTFSGLPSNGAPASPDVQYDHNGRPFLTGTAPLVFFTLDFGFDPLPLNDGDIGWSFLQLDGDTGPALVRAPVAILGTRDALDLYSPGPPSTAHYVGTFNYGGCSGPGVVPPCANFFMQFTEIPSGDVARTLVLNGSGTNPVLLEEVFPARLGHIWAARVRVVAPPWPNPDFTVLYAAAAPATTPIGTPWGEILLDFTQLSAAPLVAEGSYTYAIPADTALLGRRLFLQAAVLRPAVARLTLTNALDVRVGY
jgi:hypothetical protein